MTPQEHARDLILRLSAIKPEGPDDVPDLLTWSFEKAINEERERCAKVVETTLRDDFKTKVGKERGLSEAEVFLAAAIRRGHQ